MKRLYLTLIFMVLIAGLQPIKAQGQVNIIYGVEWGGILNFHKQIYALYQTKDQYLVEYHDAGPIHHLNGLLNVYGGIGIPSAEFSVHCGYQGVDKDFRVIPVSLRATAFLDKERVEGIYFLGEGGTGIPIRKIDLNSYSGSVGLGYRINLNGKASLNYSLAFTLANYQPKELDDPYSDEFVDPELIRVSHAKICGFVICVGLNF